MSAVAASRRYGVSTRTLRRYTEAGTLPDVRGAGGRRIFRRAELDALLLHRKGDRVVAYARVSSRRQQAEGDLDRQVERLRDSRPDQELVVFTDVASGLSDRRSRCSIRPTPKRARRSGCSTTNVRTSSKMRTAKPYSRVDTQKPFLNTERY